MKSWLSREESAGDFLKLQGNWGLNNWSTYQEGEGGIADALRLAEDFSDGESLCVMLGDNILEGSM